jgi:hypothetical protein
VKLAGQLKMLSESVYLALRSQRIVALERLSLGCGCSATFCLVPGESDQGSSGPPPTLPYPGRIQMP